MNKKAIEVAAFDDIKRLAGRIKDNWALCQLFEGTRCASEGEMMVAQTLHASVINHDKHGQAFSFRGAGVRAPRQCDGTNNGFAYQTLLEREYFIESEFEGKPTIVMTDKLVKVLDGFLAKQE